MPSLFDADSRALAALGGDMKSLARDLARETKAKGREALVYLAGLVAREFQTQNVGATSRAFGRPGGEAQASIGVHSDPFATHGATYSGTAGVGEEVRWRWHFVEFGRRVPTRRARTYKKRPGKKVMVFRTRGGGRAIAREVRGFQITPRPIHGEALRKGIDRATSIIGDAADLFAKRSR